MKPGLSAPKFRGNLIDSRNTEPTSTTPKDDKSVIRPAIPLATEDQSLSNILGPRIVLAAVHHSDCSHEWSSQALIAARVLPRAVAVHEAAEQVRQQLQRDVDTGVANRQRHLAALRFQFDVDVDITAAR